ncbi:MAG: hypothetical protein WCO13_12675 [Bacteroidota bacterium]
MIQIFTSCLCFRKTPPSPPAILLIQKDSSYTTVVYKDTTIQIRLPPDTIYSIDTIFIKPGNVLYIAPKTIKKGIISASAYIQNNKLYLSAYLNDSTFYYPLKNAIRSTTTNNIRSTATQLPSSSLPKENQLFLLLAIFMIIIIAVIVIFLLSKSSK